MLGGMEVAAKWGPGMAELGKSFRLNRIRTDTIALTTIVWSLAVFGVLVWQALLYRGIIANIGEWQFSTFRRYFPVGTIVLLFALLTAPFHFVLIRRVRRRAKIEARFEPGNAVLIARVQFWRTWLTATTAFLVVAALAVIGHAYTIGAVATSELPVRVGSKEAADPGDGQRRLSGVALNDRIAIYSENYVVARREFAVVPVVATGADGRTFTYFAQVEKPVAGPPAPFERSGFLHQERLAGALRAMYIQAGYEVTTPAWILYRDLESARWTHLRIAGIISLVAIIVGFLAIRQMRRLQKLRELAK